MKLVYDLTGNKYGRLAPLYYVYKNKIAYWYCECDCGNYIFVISNNLKSGNTQSCGCFRKEQIIKTKRIPHIFIDNIEYKRCGSCKELFTLDNFYIRENRNLNSECKSCASQRGKKYYKENTELITNRNKTYIEKNKIVINEYKSNWQKNHRVERNEKLKQRYKNEPNYRLAVIHRGRINSALKSNIKAETSIKLLGCTIEEFKKHLESQFDEKMTWDNHGNYWNIDHIIPCVAFDLSKPEQQKECFNYNNMQPMKANENFSKNDFLPDGTRGRDVREKTNRLNLA